MPNLGTLAHKRIVQVKNAEAKGMEEIMRKPGLETGARVVWSPNPATAIPCVVLGRLLHKIYFEQRMDAAIMYLNSM